MLKLNKRSIIEIKAHIFRFINRILHSGSQSSLIQNLATVGLGDFFGQLLNVGTAIFLIRGLTILDYAAFSAMSSVANLSAGLVGGGVNLALVRFSADYISRTGKKFNSMYSIVLVVEIVFFIVITVFSLLFPEMATRLVLGQSDFQAPLQFGLLYGMGILLTQLGRSIYQAEEKFKRFVAVLWLRQGVTLLFILCLWAFNLLAYQNVAIVIAGVYISIGAWIFYKSSGINDIKHLTKAIVEGKSYVSQFLAASGWLIGYFLMLTLISQIDILTLTRFSSKEEIATYGVALRYYLIALTVLGSINSVLLPRFSRVEMQSGERQRTFVSRWIKFTFWLIVPVLIFDVFGKPLFVWVNGSQYDGAFNIWIVFSIGVWLSMILSPPGNILISRGNFRFLFVVAFFSAIFCLSGCYFLIPLWGGFGAAVIMVSTYNLAIQVPVLIKVLRDN